MEQLTVVQAAIKWDAETFGWPTKEATVTMEETKTREWNIEAFKAGAEWQKEQSNWININDKLPSYQTPVLVHNTEGSILIAKRYINGWVAYFADGEKFMNELGPTHWQPLPEPPKPEQLQD